MPTYINLQAARLYRSGQWDKFLDALSERQKLILVAIGARRNVAPKEIAAKMFESRQGAISTDISRLSQSKIIKVAKRGHYRIINPRLASYCGEIPWHTVISVSRQEVIQVLESELSSAIAAILSPLIDAGIFNAKDPEYAVSLARCILDQGQINEELFYEGK